MKFTPRCIIQLWSDFQYVRRNANRPLDGVTIYGNGSADFKMMPSTIRFDECCYRLPKWLRKLARMTASTHHEIQKHDCKCNIEHREGR